MRYLLNLPLVIAALSAGAIIYWGVLAELPHGNDAKMGVGIGVNFGALVYWLALAFVLAGLARRGALGWLPVEGAGAVALVLLAWVVLILVWSAPAFITIMVQFEDKSWGIDQVWPARFVAVGLPVVLLAYAAWLINAPAPLGDSASLRWTMLGAVAAIGLAASVVVVKEMARWERNAQEAAAREQEFEDGRIAAKRQAFAALTEADSLLRWDEFTGYYQTPADVRDEALRRIGQRPDLEAELIEVLASSNGNWVEEGLRLIQNVPFTPSAALGEPVRAALLQRAEGLSEASKSETYAGDNAIDRYDQGLLRMTLALGQRMAESAGVDLRAALDAMQHAAALYPKSDAAQYYPAQVAEAKRAIAKTLATRRASAPVASR
jgi:hypothetical protein